MEPSVSFQQHKGNPIPARFSYSLSQRVWRRYGPYFLVRQQAKAGRDIALNHSGPLPCPNETLASRTLLRVPLYHDRTLRQIGNHTVHSCFDLCLTVFGQSLLAVGSSGEKFIPAQPHAQAGTFFQKL